MLLILLGVSQAPKTTIAAGVYVDVAGDVAFLTSTQAHALAGRIIRSDGSDADASLYVLDLAFTVRSYALLELDIPIVTKVEPNSVVTGIGDLVLRFRARVYQKPRRVFHVLSAFRAGNGTTDVYPFASQSLDLEVGIGYVDSLDYVHVWATAGGAFVARQPENIPEEDLHGGNGRVSAGLRFPFTARLSAGVGATALVYGSNRAREIYIVTVDYRRSQRLNFALAAHVEGGRSAERVGDTSLTAGLRVYY